MSDWSALEREFPHVADARGEDWWRIRLEESPEIAWRMVVDLFDNHARERERDRGEVRIGRRPSPDPVAAEHMLEVVFPEQFTDLPFREALVQLMDGRSQRQFARKVPCDQSSLSRLLSGEATPSMEVMAALARAGGRQPYYFVEWRAGYLGDLIRDAYLRSPRKSAVLLRAMGERLRSRTRV